MGRYVKTIIAVLLSNILTGRCFGGTNFSIRYITSYLKEGKLMTIEDINKFSVDVLKPIIFLIGNGSDASDNWYTGLAEAYTEKLISNVFIVNWRDDQLATVEYLSHFINAMYNKSGEDFLFVHLIGISKGCNVALSTADKLNKLKPSRRVMRITCLDPNDIEHLSVASVDYLDVVYSEYNETINDTADASFYIVQSCSTANCTASHSLDIFHNSVNLKTIHATKCDTLDHFNKGECDKNDKVIFGENVSKATRGQYFLKV